MKVLKISLPLLALFSVLNLNCATPIPNVPVCVSISESLGWCQNTIDNQSFYVDNDKQVFPGTGEKWILVKAKAVIVPHDSWAKIKEYILTMCKKNNSCSANYDAIKSKMDSLL